MKPPKQKMETREEKILYQTKLDLECEKQNVSELHIYHLYLCC